METVEKKNLEKSRKKVGGIRGSKEEWIAEIGTKKLSKAGIAFREAAKEPGIITDMKAVLK